MRNNKTLEENFQKYVTDEDFKKKLKKLKKETKSKNNVKCSIYEPFYNNFFPFVIEQYKRYSDTPKKERYITDKITEFMKKYVEETCDRVMDNYNSKAIDKDTFVESMNFILEIKKDFWVV